MQVRDKNAKGVKQEMQEGNGEVLVLSPTRAGFQDKYKLETAQHTHLALADHYSSPDSPGWPQIPYVAEDDSEFLDLSPPLPRAGVTGVRRQFCFSVVLETEPGASSILGKHSDKLHPSPLFHSMSYR